MNNNTPTEWASLIQQGDEWVWKDDVLWDRMLLSNPPIYQPVSPLQRSLVKYVYGNHNRSASVQRALGKLLDNVKDNEWGLNLGAGDEQLHPRVLNLDIFAGKGINIVGTGSQLPFKDASVSLVVCQEVLEHVASPSAVIAEVSRVLRRGGTFYFQVPFQIGFHPGPKDYWRFSRQGCEELLNSDNWNVEKIELTQGHGTALYRISVEFFAVTASCFWRKLYLPIKGFSAVVLSPLKLFDRIAEWSDQRDRIAAGYYCVGKKRS